MDISCSCYFLHIYIAYNYILPQSYHKCNPGREFLKRELKTTLRDIHCTPHGKKNAKTKRVFLWPLHTEAAAYTSSLVDRTEGDVVYYESNYDRVKKPSAETAKIF